MLVMRSLALLEQPQEAASANAWYCYFADQVWMHWREEDDRQHLLDLLHHVLVFRQHTCVHMSRGAYDLRSILM